VLESTETAEKVIFLGVVSAYHQLKKIRTVFSELFQKIITTKWDHAFYRTFCSLGDKMKHHKAYREMGK